MFFSIYFDILYRYFIGYIYNIVKLSIFIFYNINYKFILFYYGGIMEQKKLDVNKLHSTYDAIKELYLSYCEELDQEKKNLEKIENDIKEIKDYLSYLENHQNSDTFVFSPRGVISKNSSSGQESVYDTGKVIDFNDSDKKKEELQSLENNKKSCEEKISKLSSTITVLSDNKEILKEVVSKEELADEEQKAIDDQKNQIMKELEEKKENFSKGINGTLEKLDFMNHSLDLMDSYIMSDPMRAKLELKPMKQNITSVAVELKKMVQLPEENK